MIQSPPEVCRVNYESQIVNYCARLAERDLSRYLAGVNGLTKQEITVLSLIAALLLIGWFVKYYRATHH